MYKTRKPVVTYILLAIQIVVFILETMNGGSTNAQVLFHYGAKTNWAVANGQSWRLITAMFVHIGFMHIVVNSLTLYYLGIELEKLLGSIRFTFIYFVSGIMGNLMSFSFGSDQAISAGASTALFGLFASFITIAYINRGDRYWEYLGRQYALLIVMNIVFDLFISGIDIWGHLGGIVGGVLSTIVVYPGQINISKTKQRLLKTTSFLVILIIAVLLYRNGMTSY